MCMYNTSEKHPPRRGQSAGCTEEAEKAAVDDLRLGCDTMYNTLDLRKRGCDGESCK